MAIVQSDGAIASSSVSLASGRYNSSLPGGYVSWYSGLASSYEAIYRTQPNLRLVIDFLARNMAQLKLKPYKRVSDTERLSLRDHAIGRLIRTPNLITKTTRYRYFHAYISDLGLYDMFFALKTKNPVTGDLRLWRLPPQLMEPVDGDLWNATTWRFLGLNSQPIFSWDDLYIHRGYNPLDSRLGLSPIESIRQTLSEGQAAAEYREQFWRGGARISGVIERPASGAGTPRWSPEAKERFLAEWKSEFTGDAPGAGGTPLLEDGMAFKQVSFSAKDSEYLGARRLSREEVAAFYHVSPLFVGILENANFSNVKEQHRHLYQDTLGPTLVSTAEEFHLQIVPEYDDLDFDSTYLEFDLKEKLKGSFEEEAQAQQTSVGGPWRTRNEARALDNLPPVDGGDELITPLNVITGGQASPTDSSPLSNSLPPGYGIFKAIESPKKSVDDLPDNVKSWFDKHVEMLGGLFDRQKNAVVAALGAGSSIETIWDEARWNGELKADFLDLAKSMGAELGAEVADAFDGNFDPDAMDEYLQENSRIAAENVNNTTKQAISDLDSSDDGFLDSVRNVFAVGAASRAAQIATTRVTSVGNFARKEGAQQGGALYKVWNVRSSNSRHPNMNGQKVEIDAEFSNGARWPADHSLPEDQRAGCVCSMDFER